MIACLPDARPRVPPPRPRAPRRPLGVRRRPCLPRDGAAHRHPRHGPRFHPALGPVLAHCGVIPLAARGYVVLVDAERVAGRRLTEAEYRACRDPLDRGVPLPPGRTLRRAPVARPRRARPPHRPVASRLGQGRVGAVMFAHALGVPVVPAGMSGCREVFRGPSMALRGGAVDARFGEAYRPELDFHQPPAGRYDILGGVLRRVGQQPRAALRHRARRPPPLSRTAHCSSCAVTSL